MSTIILADRAERTAERLESIEAHLDAITIRQLEAVGVAPGWSCLDLGRGSGSTARWLAEHVGPNGRVVVTDVDASGLADEHPNVEVKPRALAACAFGPGAFALTRERLVLPAHGRRYRSLYEMIDALEPGGWVLLEHVGPDSVPPVPIGTPAGATLHVNVRGGFHELVQQARAGLAYGRRYQSILGDAGLLDINVEVHFKIAPDGGAARYSDFSPLICARARRASP